MRVANKRGGCDTSGMSSSYWGGVTCAVGMLVIGVASAQGVRAQGARLVSDGVFTEEQATRGADAYMKSCAGCHMPDLRGEGFAPQLNAEAFTLRWEGGKLGDLLKIVAGTMPQDAPGSLPAPQYADIVAFLLKSNGFKPGAQPLSENPADSPLITFPKK
jgi:mono/diheme cytochrome c family protein